MLELNRSLFILALLACIVLVDAQGSIESAIVTGNYNQFCNTSATATINPTCWDYFNATDFLTNSSTGFASIPGCGGSVSGYCCRSGETWSQCFLRLSYGNDIDCGTLNASNTCKWSEDNVPSVPRYGTQRWRYVLRAIFGRSSAVQNTFVRWSKVIQGVPTASTYAMLNNLTALIDPGKRATYRRFGPSVAALAGLALLDDPENANVSKTLDQISSALARAFSVGLDNAPKVAQALFSATTLTNQSSALNQTIPLLSQPSYILTPNIDAAFGELFGNMASFVNFTRHGAFTYAFDEFISQEKTAAFELGLGTYFTSNAFAGNNYLLAVSRTDTAAQAACVAQDPVNWFCGGRSAIWYDLPSQLTFQIVYNGTGRPSTAPGSASTWRSIFTQGYTTPEALFAGAYNCTIGGERQVTKNTSQAVGIDRLTTGGPNYGCLSAFTVCQGVNSTTGLAFGDIISPEIPACPANILYL